MSLGLGNHRASESVRELLPAGHDSATDYRFDPKEDELSWDHGDGSVTIMNPYIVKTVQNDDHTLMIIELPHAIPYYEVDDNGDETGNTHLADMDAVEYAIGWNSGYGNICKCVAITFAQNGHISLNTTYQTYQQVQDAWAAGEITKRQRQGFKAAITKRLAHERANDFS